MEASSLISHPRGYQIEISIRMATQGNMNYAHPQPIMADLLPVVLLVLTYTIGVIHRSNHIPFCHVQAVISIETAESSTLTCSALTSGDYLVVIQRALRANKD
ncbi:hypothetical protein BDZ91DRAFT_752500 [Kalaharituber pfeilii]|nr:hypothetical protein BDZ91DRAFT_752500 [Kalaharituber pfeilii]